MAKGFKLNWKGDIVISLSEEALMEIVADIGSTAEAESRRELTPGHGVLSGDLRRSVHVAEPGHVFVGETGKSDLAGKRVLPTKEGNQYKLALGSGLVYAMAIHQGWPRGYPGLHGSFIGYHYLTKGVDRAKLQVNTIVLRNRLR